MATLKGFQKQYLKGLAHAKQPQIFVGKNGMTPTLVTTLEQAVEKNELVKVKFVDCKEKSEKVTLVGAIVEKTGCELVGMIGHVATLYRPAKDPAKRKIVVPNK